MGSGMPSFQVEHRLLLSTIPKEPENPVTDSGGKDHYAGRRKWVLHV